MGMYESSVEGNGTGGLAARYGVGEVADLIGVPDPYDAGDSYFMRPGIWYSKNKLPETIRSQLLSTNASSNVAAANDALDTVSINANALSGWFKPLAISGSDVKVLAAHVSGGVCVIDDAGPQLVSTGLTGYQTVLSDGTAFYAITSGITSATDGQGTALSAGSVSKSLDGKSWSVQQSISWPAAFLVRNRLYPFGNGNVSTGMGLSTAAGNASKQSAIFWAGDVAIAVVDDGTNYKVASSNNCLVWTDVTTSVLGATAIPLSGNNIHVYALGNTAFIQLGSTVRYTTDGGLSWSTPAVIPRALDASVSDSYPGYLQHNSADPARLLALRSGTGLFVTTTAGSTWADRSGPLGIVSEQLLYQASPSFIGMIAYKDSIIFALSTNRKIKRSLNDGESFDTLSLPNTVIGYPLSVTSDAYRLYIFMSSGQYITTPDGVTLTIRSGRPTLNMGPCVSIDANTTVFMGTKFAYTTDGGVTMKEMAINTRSVYVGCTSVGLISVGSKFYLYGGQDNANQDLSAALIDLDDVLAGGSSFRASSVTINPVRANMTPFVRVK